MSIIFLYMLWTEFLYLFCLLFLLVSFYSIFFIFCCFFLFFIYFFFFFSSRRRHTRLQGDWSSDVCCSDLAGDGLGFVLFLTPSGRLIGHLEHGPCMNSPWGVVWTPRDFGEYSTSILVGNFG